VDSPRVRTALGQRLDLKAVVAPDGRAAAQVYPANYWLGLLEIPQGEHSAKEIALETKACFSCHQVGTRATRELTKGVSSYASSLGAWDQHVMMGPNGVNMSGVLKRLGAQHKAFADWTDRIAAGAYPEAPPRQTGVERNLVISMWDWALPTSRRSDAAGTDERDLHCLYASTASGPRALPPYSASPLPALYAGNLTLLMPFRSRRE
jgi:hypothetical protein